MLTYPTAYWWKRSFDFNDQSFLAGRGKILGICKNYNRKNFWFEKHLQSEGEELYWTYTEWILSLWLICDWSNLLCLIVLSLPRCSRGKRALKDVPIKTLSFNCNLHHFNLLAPVDFRNWGHHGKKKVWCATLSSTYTLVIYHWI